MINRSYLQQVAMIESECEPRRKPQPMLSTYTKSPLRDRESTSIVTQIDLTWVTLQAEWVLKPLFHPCGREELSRAWQAELTSAAGELNLCASTSLTRWLST